MFDPLRNAILDIRKKATELRDTFGDDARARAIEWAATCVEQALLAVKQTPLTLSEAATHSGHSADHLSRLIRDSKLPNAGRKGAPCLKAADISVKPITRVASRRRKPYNPITDARALRTSG